jgi:hypothetical protein
MEEIKQVEQEQQVESKDNTKVNKFWYNGNLISREEHDKLSWEEIHNWNNRITKPKKN